MKEEKNNDWNIKEHSYERTKLRKKSGVKGKNVY